MAKRKNKRRYRKKKILFGLEVAVLLILLVALFGYSKLNEKMGLLHLDNSDTDNIEVNDEVFKNKYLKGYTNIALFGVDSRDGSLETGNSDTAIIASINNDTKEVKLVSIYRDTYLNINGEKYSKCNAAYSQGGPSESISMINTNLDLNITNYVAVDFKALSTVIDCLGGLDVDLAYDEIVHINNYCVETSEVTGMSYKDLPLPEEVPENREAIIGTYHLNGVQATSYCRIRYTTGWDMKRTERQRYIISLIVEEAKSSSLGTLNKIVDEVFPLVKTNFSKSDLIKLGTGIFSYKLGETSGFPTANIMGEDVVNAIGLDCVVPITLEVNVRALHDFLFGEGDYNVSETVMERSRYIADHTGFGSAYVPDEYKHWDSSSDTSEEYGDEVSYDEY